MTNYKDDSRFKIRSRDQQVVFTNPTDEDFEGTWDFANNQRIYKIKAGQSVYLPFYKAELFAHKIADRELIKQGKKTNHHSRDEILNQCVNVEMQDKAARPAEVEYVNLQPVALNRDVQNKQVEEEHGASGQVGYDKEALRQSQEPSNQQPKKESVPESQPQETPEDDFEGSPEDEDENGDE